MKINKTQTIMKIPFGPEERTKYYSLLDKIFDSSILSHGPMNEKFETLFSDLTGLHSATVTNAGAGLFSLLKYVNVRDAEVIVPTNTFMATPLAVKLAGGKVVFADCKKEDLCIGLDQIKAVRTKETKAVVVVHIGGHIAFDIFEIAKYCEEEGLALIEDCAHAHGATYKGRSAGSFGIGGAYSFYATKTLPIGEGGIIVSTNTDVIEFVKRFRNYGKVEYSPGKFKYPEDGFNFRLSEAMAALGIIQVQRLPEIIEWKKKLAKKYDIIFAPNERINLPADMQSGYYKYIVFNPNVALKTGSVFEDLCHNLMNIPGSFPNSEWISKNHSCPPIWYGWEHAELEPSEIKSLLLKN